MRNNQSYAQSSREDVPGDSITEPPDEFEFVNLDKSLFTPPIRAVLCNGVIFAEDGLSKQEAMKLIISP